MLESSKPFTVARCARRHNSHRHGRRHGTPSPPPRPATPRAATEFFPLVLRRTGVKLGRRAPAQDKAGRTSQPTALVHEAYILLVYGTGRGTGTGRLHFFRRRGEGPCAASSSNPHAARTASNEAGARSGWIWMRSRIGRRDRTDTPLQQTESTPGRTGPRGPSKADWSSVRYFSGAVLSRKRADALECPAPNRGRYSGLSQGFCLYCRVPPASARLSAD